MAVSIQVKWMVSMAWAMQFWVQMTGDPISKQSLQKQSILKYI